MKDVKNIKTMPLAARQKKAVVTSPTKAPARRGARKTAVSEQPPAAAPARTRKAPARVAAPAPIAAAEPPERRWWWVAGFGVGVVLLGITTFFAHRQGLGGLDLSVLRHINDLPDKLRLAFLVLTIAPDSLLIGAAAVVIVFLFKLYQLAWQMAATVLTAAAAGLLAKHAIAEPRPGTVVGGLHVRVHETDPAFPSGHTMMITVVVLTLWPYLPRGWRWVAACAIPVVGVARIYLGVHSPVDIVGGFALGLVIVSAIRALPEPLRRFFRLD